MKEYPTYVPMQDSAEQLTVTIYAVCYNDNDGNSYQIYLEGGYIGWNDKEEEEGYNEVRDYGLHSTVEDAKAIIYEHLGLGFYYRDGKEDKEAKKLYTITKIEALKMYKTTSDGSSR